MKEKKHTATQKEACGNEDTSDNNIEFQTSWVQHCLYFVSVSNHLADTYNLNCRFGCLTNEDQNHIFSECQEIQSQLNHKGNINIDYIYQDLDKQLEVIHILTHIDQVRWNLKDKLLPGDETKSQDPRTQFVVRQTFQSEVDFKNKNKKYPRPLHKAKVPWQ